MPKKVHEDAWGLDDEHMAVLAAIASVKETTMPKIASAGNKVEPSILNKLVSLELVKRTSDEPAESASHRITTPGRSLLWHRKWHYTGHPMFAHTPVVRWALYIEKIFGEIKTSRMEMDLGITAKELEPYLAKMAEHSMIIRDGNTAILLDRSKWKMDC